MLDLGRIQDFSASSARVLDRRRMELAVGAGDPEATLAVGRCARSRASTGRAMTMAVTGGKPDEAMRPLDFSPEPDRPIRDLLDPQTSKPISTASKPSSTTTAAGMWTGSTGRPPAGSSGAAGRRSAQSGSFAPTDACESPVAPADDQVPT